MLVGVLAHQHYGPSPAVRGELAELAPGLSNDGQRSPTKQASAVADPVLLGVIGDRALLTALARREVRQ